MKWGEFKAAVEAQGVTDDMQLWFIDWHHVDKDVKVGRAEEDILGVCVT